MTEASKEQLAEHFFRHSYAKMLAILVRYFGLREVEIAEDILQETLVEAMEKWSVHAIPDNPEGWLMDVAKKKTINFLRRHQTFETKVLPNVEIGTLFENESLEEDSTLRMVFTCCHPSLPVASQIALALKTLCGLSIGEIAHALLTNEATVNKRLYRAKQKFRAGEVTFDLPPEEALNARLDAVFTTLYLLFNEGYYSAHHEKVIRMDLCFEAIRLTKEIVRLYSEVTRAKALLALMLLNVARFESRVDEAGTLVLLSDQNRALWDQGLIGEGMEYLSEAIQSEEVSPYHLQAGIAAEHCLAQDFATTNWAAIYRQYQILEKLQPSPLLSLNKAIARFYGINREEALMDLLQLKKEPALQQHVHYHTAIGVCYVELGLSSKAQPYFQQAFQLSKSDQEKQLIAQKMDQ